MTPSAGPAEAQAGTSWSVAAPSVEASSARTVGRSSPGVVTARSARATSVSAAGCARLRRGRQPAGGSRVPAGHDRAGTTRGNEAQRSGRMTCRRGSCGSAAFVRDTSRTRRSRRGRTSCGRSGLRAQRQRSRWSDGPCAQSDTAEERAGLVTGGTPGARRAARFSFGRERERATCHSPRRSPSPSKDRSPLSAIDKAHSWGLCATPLSRKQPRCPISFSALDQLPPAT